MLGLQEPLNTILIIVLVLILIPIAITLIVLLVKLFLIAIYQIKRMINNWKLDRLYKKFNEAKTKDDYIKVANKAYKLFWKSFWKRDIVDIQSCYFLIEKCDIKIRLESD